MGKSSYEPWVTEDGLARIVEWCGEGRVDKQIAQMIGITPGTLCEWKNRFPNIAEAFKTGRSQWFATALPEVENAAYKLATGYTYTETTEERKELADGSYGLVVTKVVTKHQPANPVSNMYWLQNRAPDTWKDRRNVGQEPDESGETGVIALTEIKQEDK